MIKSRTIKDWLRSIRIGHLTGLAVAVVAMRYSFYGEIFPTTPLLEILFILPIIFISAGGNIINDYFDIREDRIKRPQKAIIGRTLNRRTAMMSHWVLSGLGLATAILLSTLVNSFIPIAIVFPATFFLFLYSWLKRKLIIGNIVVASIATAFIPLSLCDVDMRHLGDKYDWLCCLVFTTIFIRQLVKDIEDYKVDLSNGFKTFVVVFSPNKAWLLIYAIEIWVFILASDAIKYSPSLAYQFFMGTTILGTLYFSWRKKTQAVSAWVRLLLLAGLAWVALYGY